MEGAVVNSDFRSVLRDELIQRSKDNPRYTLRSFARYLDLSPATLSNVLNGKRKLSIKRAGKIAQRLDLSPTEGEKFVDLVVAEHAPRKTAATKKAGKEESDSSEVKQLTMDTYQAIADWYHGAIMEMTFIKGVKVTPRTVATKLKCTYMEASDAIERLKRLGLLEERGGRLVKVEKHYETTTDVPSSALRRRHLQVLQKAKHALVMSPIQERDITSMTIAIDSSKLPEAKARIKQFRRDLCEFLEEGNRDKVYELSIQLFSLM